MQSFLPEPFKFVLNTKKFQNVWYVYSISNSEKLIYVGVADARHLMTLHDAMSNPYVLAMVTADEFVLIEVLSSHHTQSDARKAAFPLISTRQPVGNQYGMAASSKKKSVKCNETGTTFKSVGDAAQWLGVAPSSMSNHLHRRPGYAHIRNHTFDFEAIR